MKKRILQALAERFGDPIEPVFGVKIGKEPGITKVGAVGVKDVSEDVMICPTCKQFPIDGNCGCDHSSSKDEGTICSGCGMMVVGGNCGCTHDDVCPVCNQLPPQINTTCGCNISENKGTCSECGMSEATCECGMNEVSPPGHEKMVKGLKKSGNVENPWAVAWDHYKKKHPGGHGKRHQ